MSDSEKLKELELVEFNTVDTCTVYTGSLDNLVKVNDQLNWHTEYAQWAGMEIKSLTLGEIYEQLKDKCRIITVFASSPLHGDIYQCGNYEQGKWVKYGETIGYA